ncbi:hemagglutinin repeat-containing protein [Winslowiella arboricola]|uniref:hemagglutinin repeat-containing protein n=1 Tax=Winslowiella arboricola TaxID=2978220 RepID=UPI00225DF6F9|nr:hemagglutinin repeat-containing protein [Winslowiella arboricola]MCU5774492.1 hemagglutinin repeat-containing protein [Winslowiella arboricola]
MENRLHPLRLPQRLLSYLICGLIAWQPLLPAISASINPVNGNTQLDKAGNGVPVLNIATPNKAGISHNQFKDYNVGKEGLILNNATGQLTQTQLGGLIQNNTNLTAGKEAKGIINEVVGANRSQLQGYTEVAGKAANVMVANPYGITCSGCGFINTPGATLTTGKPSFDSNGNLQALTVSKGTITVEGQGLDASQSDALSIISRATEVNAAIHARDLKVIAGANKVAADGGVTAIAGEGIAPTVAVDTGALGGMYANRIHLISSDKGVGVNLGNLNARQGDMVLDASGKLALNNSLTSGTLTAKGASVTLSGDNKVSGGATVTAQQDLTLQNGTLVSDKSIALSGGENVRLSNAKLTAGADIQLAAGDLTVDTASTADATGNISVNAQRSMNNAGQLTAGADIDLHAATASNSGTLVAKKQLSSRSEQLTNSGKLVGDTLDIDSKTLNNRGEMLAGQQLKIAASSLQQSGTLNAKGSAQLAVSGKIVNAAGGKISGDQQLQISSAALVNNGTLLANDFALDSREIGNSGLIQGTQSLSLLSDQLDNLTTGSIYTAGDLTLDLPQFTNSGLLTSDSAMYLSGDRLTNDGEINAATLTADNRLFNIGAQGLMLASGTMQLNHTQLDNAGQLAANRLDLHAGTLNNSGKIIGQQAVDVESATVDNRGWLIGKALTLKGDLVNSGLLQGDESLGLQGDQLVNASEGQLLTGGNATIAADSLENRGLVQADGLQVTARQWDNRGTALATSTLNAELTDKLDNSGSLLSSGDITLNGGTLTNSGSVQGKTLTITPAQVINRGALIGLQALTLGTARPAMGRMALAAPAQELRNENNGTLLTQGTLTVNGGTVTNNGSWQGQQILLHAQQLNNNGSIQSAGDLQLVLSDSLNSASGSKISASGNAALQALALTSQGEWIAKNLTLTGGTLNNDGVISGVESLTADLSGGFTQQQNKTMLSGGTLTLNAASVNNLGSLQGDTLQIGSGVLTNSGRLQGDNGLTLNLTGNLTNNASGTLLSQQGVNLTTPNLINYGLIQGGATSTVDATSSARNEGKLLNSGQLTLTTAQLINSGWLQATTLILNAANATNSGTLLAEQQGTLSGNTLTNQGVTQGGNLAVNYQQLTNSGTLLGNSQLNVTAAQVTQQAAGKLFSGGNLLLTSNGFDQLGLVVALGDATLKLVDAFTGRGTIAAGNRLTVSSDGNLLNSGVMQGQGLTLTAGGTLTNNGQLTTGSADSALSGSQIAMNSAGSLQGGGNVSLTSRGNITLNGFTGTKGTMTLTAPGSIINTALLYAGNNLYLLANSIKNQRGDILAGNSLWMQRDAAGNANTEVVNSSGTIETNNGDITIKTGHLLNTREGLSVTSTTQKASDVPEGTGAATVDVRLGDLDESELGYNLRTRESGGSEANGAGKHEIRYYTLAPNELGAVKRYLSEILTLEVTATGGSGRIASGRNLDITATTLDNQASAILADKMITLRGSSLNNASWLNSVRNTYLTYQFDGQPATYELDEDHGMTYFAGLPIVTNTQVRVNNLDSHVTYRLASAPEYETLSTGGNYRSVIQAGGTVNASFSNNISNTSTNANAGGISNILAAPSLNTLSQAGISGAQQKQALSGSDKVTIDSPQWHDQLQDALQIISGGDPLANSGTSGNLQGKSVDTSAYPLPTSNSGYFVTSGDPKSPYLITVNPKLNGLGELDQNLYGDLYKLLGQQPTGASQETRSQYTDEKQFLGSAYLLDRLQLNPEYDYRFLGDAAFDTRYVSNTVLNQTGSRYLNGLGSELDQMRYLMDNAAAAQQSLGLEFGVSLTAVQVGALDHSIIWWEASTVNGETVMVPKVYLSTKDVAINNGSVIAGNNVVLEAGVVTNNGSTLIAANDLTVDSQNSVSNLNDALVKAGGNLQLSALGDINNIGSAISGKMVALESTNGSINNITKATQWQFNSSEESGEKVGLSHTWLGNSAAITSLDSLTLNAGKDIAITGAEIKAGGDLQMNASGDIAITANTINDTQSQSGFAYNARKQVQSSSSTDIRHEGSTVTAGGNLGISAGNNLTASASAVDAGKNASLTAGNDLNLQAKTTQQASSKGNAESHASGLDRATLTSGGDLTLKAGRDLTSQAAAMAAEGDVALQGGRDINLQAVATTSGSSYYSGNKTEIDQSVRQQGTEIASGGDTTLQAGRDISSAATQVTAQQDIAVKAGGDINLTTANESDYHFDEETTVKKRLFSKTTTHTIAEDYQTTEKGTQLSGKSIAIKAQNDITLTGASVAGETAVTLDAGNNLNIEAATQTESTYRLHEVTKSGLMSGGGLGITIGKQSAKGEYSGAQVTQSDSRSMVGAAGGNVTLSAGNNLVIKGSDVIAGRAANDTQGATGNINAAAQNIAILAGQDQVRESYTQEAKSSGIGLSLSVTALDSLRNIRDALQSSGSVYQQVKAVGNELGAASLDNPSGFSLTYNKSSSNASQASESLYQSGSTLSAGGDVRLTAVAGKANASAGNILLEGGSIVAGGIASLQASGDIAIITSSDSQKVTSNSQSKAMSLTSSPSLGALARMGGNSPNNGDPGVPFGLQKQQENSDGAYLTQHASSITGNAVSLTSSDGDITLAGSTLTGVQGVNITAANGNVNIISGDNQQLTSSSGSSTTLGELGGDGYSGTVGWGNSAWKNVSEGNQQSSVRSGIVSEQGDVHIVGAKDVLLQGADVYAGKSLDIAGRNIELQTAQDNEKSSSNSHSTQYGVTTAVSGYAVSIAQAADKIADARANNSDPRLQAIYAAQAALTALSSVYQNTAAVKVSVSATAGSSHQSQEQQATAQSGTTIKADQDVALKADQDITGKGVQIAGENISLTAGGNIALSSAQDTSSLKSDSGGNKFGVGVGFGLGGSQNGFSIELSASQYSANASGNNLTNHNSQVDASKTLTVTSGENITLNGANLSGNRVEVNAGKNLLIASQQDTSSYNSKQNSSGLNVSICVPPICLGAPVQGSASTSGGKLYNDYASVQQQSGIAAGDAGYGIYVGNHTQLDGAVISSTASADKNHLSTGTLGWTDIDNHAAQAGKGYGVSVSSESMPVATLGQAGSDATSTTYSAVSAGTIDIRNPDAQQQDVASLSRDTANASNALNNDFDAQKLEDKLTIQRELGALGQQAIGLAFDYQKDKAQKAARERLSKEDDGFSALSAEEQQKKIEASPEYQQVNDEYGIGSKNQIVAQAITGALAALAGGNQGGALAAGAAPLLAQTIKQASEGSEAMRVLLHTVVSGLLAKAQGGSVAGGLVAAVSAEEISQLFFQKSASKLNAEEKQLLATLVTIASAGAGGLAGSADGAAGAASGAFAGKTEVENNYLSQKDITTFTEKYANAKTDEEREQLLADLKKLDAEQQIQALSTGISIADQKDVLADLKALAASPECTAKCQELAAYSISELEPVANNTQLHEDNLKKGILAGVIYALTVEKPASANSTSGLSSLTKEQQQLIRNAETITTAKGIQNPFPRDLNEKVLWNGVKANPSAGETLKGMNNDPRFPASAGFQKMQVTHELPDGSNITIHYQYNSNTGKAYDMKIVTPQANPLQPGPSLKGN